MTDAEKKLWVAEIKALKAYYYFELLRHYGPFVVMDENIDPGVPVVDMKKERSPVDVCVEEIVLQALGLELQILRCEEKEMKRNVVLEKQQKVGVEGLHVHVEHCYESRVYRIHTVCHN